MRYTFSMASFFKKALGVFVEFEEEQNTTTPPEYIAVPNTSNNNITAPVNNPELEKFEKYFDNLFEKANLPGPDYFEFHKTMDLLEAHVPDEKARLSASFASLSIQGLTKEKLIDTAFKYKEIIEQDLVNFDAALNNKQSSEVEQKRAEVVQLEEKIKQNLDQIERLKQEIAEARDSIAKLNGQVTEEENKLAVNRQGYQIASQAMINKIVTDIKKIQATI